MDTIVQDASRLIALAGQYWQYALIAAFAVMIFESAKPKPEEGEQGAGPLGFTAAVASFVTPFLLFIHAYVEAVRVQMPNALLAAIVVMGGVVLLGAVIGWAIAAALTPLGRLLGRVAPIGALLVFAFTLWVTWANVYEAVQRQVLSRLGL